MKTTTNKAAATAQSIPTTTFPRRPHSHRSYGGEIYPSDFDTSPGAVPRHQTGSFIASRIIQDARFDEQCRNNALIRERITAHNSQNLPGSNHPRPQKS